MITSMQTHKNQFHNFSMGPSGNGRKNTWQGTCILVQITSPGGGHKEQGLTTRYKKLIRDGGVALL